MKGSSKNDILHANSNLHGPIGNAKHKHKSINTGSENVHFLHYRSFSCSFLVLDGVLVAHHVRIVLRTQHTAMKPKQKQKHKPNDKQ